MSYRNSGVRRTLLWATVRGSSGCVRGRGGYVGGSGGCVGGSSGCGGGGGSVVGAKWSGTRLPPGPPPGKD